MADIDLTSDPSSQTVEVRLALSVIAVAAAGGMPDSFWATDTRISLACQTLGWDYQHARDWGAAHPRWSPATADPDAGET